jgi:hypothetical protein
MAKPSEINWADGLSAIINIPGSTRRLNGWVPGSDVPPGGVVNWAWNTLSGWVTHLNGAGTYTDLSDAIDNLTEASGLPIERTFLLDEKDTDQVFGGTNLTAALVGSSDTIAVSGLAVLYSETGAGDPGEALQRDIATAVQTYTKTGLAAATTRIISDGRYVVMAYGNLVELFDAVTGVSQWVCDHGLTVADIAMDGTRVYIVGFTGGASGNRAARGIAIATGVAAWSYDHGGHLRSVATNGRQVFIMGDASSYGSKSTMRALNAMNGNDQNNESGSTAADLTGSAWSRVQADTGTGNMGLETDGRSLWLGHFSAAAPNQLERISCGDGLVVASKALGESVFSIAVDQTYLYAAYDKGLGQGFISAFDKVTLEHVWSWRQPNNTSVTAVASDGAAVFATCADPAGISIVRIWRGNRPALWRRITTNDDYLPYRQLAIPTE